jgi:hypothetical protein
MREPGELARRATGFGAALVAATGLIALLPRHAAQGPNPAVDGPDPGAEGPAERNLPTARTERKDVSFRALATGGAVFLAFIACMIGLAFWLYPQPDKVLHFQPPATYPMPTLQDDPAADMNRFRSEQLQQLNGIYWLDKAKGTVHLPIEDAMRIVAHDGIPDWPKTPYPPVVPAR